jgi:SOS response regulatory protein OraA/RecX
MPPRKPAQIHRPAVDLITQSALRYLARRDRSEAQMKAYLSRLGASATRIRALIIQFRSHHYLNDEAFALRWARKRLARRPMGRERLEAELLGQGIDQSTTTWALNRTYDEFSELDLARRFLEGRAGSPAQLRRHGFSEETIEALFDATDRGQSV